MVHMEILSPNRTPLPPDTTSLIITTTQRTRESLVFSCSFVLKECIWRINKLCTVMKRRAKTSYILYDIYFTSSNVTSETSSTLENKQTIRKELLGNTYRGMREEIPWPTHHLTNKNIQTPTSNWLRM